MKNNETIRALYIFNLFPYVLSGVLWNKQTNEKQEQEQKCTCGNVTMLRVVYMIYNNDACCCVRSLTKLDGTSMQHCSTLRTTSHQNGQSPADETVCTQRYCMLLHEMIPRFDLGLGTFRRKYDRQILSQ